MRSEVTWGEARTREVTWHDPMPPLASLRTMPGIEFLRGMIDGTVPAPPIAASLDFRIVSVGPGSATFEVDPSEFHFNPLGLVHGGVLCTLLDTVLGCAVHTTLEAGWGYTSIDLNVTYLRPVTLKSGTLTAVGTVTKGGRRVSFASGEIRDAAGAVIATGTGSLLMFEPGVG
ncbi:MAG: PaaI family thioesterase [Pseudolysinimonas sp.]